MLHGSSSIPAAAVTTINDNGGSVRPSSGISSAQKKRGIAGGIRKINQGTDSHLAWTAGVRKFATDNPAAVEPSSAVASGIAAMSDIVEQRMHEFGSAGRLRRDRLHLGDRHVQCS